MLYEECLSPFKKCKTIQQVVLKMKKLTGNYLMFKMLQIISF